MDLWTTLEVFTFRRILHSVSVRSGIAAALQLTYLEQSLLRTLESTLMKSFSKKPVYARTLTFLTASILLVSLSGCSAADDVSPDLEETTDATVADTTEPTEGPDTSEYVPASEEGPAQNVPEPRLPAVATEESVEGACRHLEYFWAAVDYARLTGNVEPLAFVSHDSCELCAEHIQGWTARYETATDGTSW